MDSFDRSKLASKILLFIFLHLDLDQLILSRRVNKQSQEAIDNNQLLRRVFEWIQQDRESFRPALDMFDQKSRSSLKKVSIQEENSNEEDLLNLMQVLKQSKRTLTDVDFQVSQPSRIGEAVELLTAGSGLRSLVFWSWGSKLGVCPKLRILVMTNQFAIEGSEDYFDFNGMLKLVQTRKKMVLYGKEIDGIKIVPFRN